MRSIVALVLALSVSLGATLAQGYDLGSLAMLATSVVKARRLGAWVPGRDPARVTRYRIVDVYAGPLHAGDTIGVGDGEYPFPDPATHSSVGPVGADVVLFLGAAPPGAADPTYPVAYDGICVALGSSAYCFTHGGNYGSVDLYARRYDADELNGDSHGTGLLDWPTFERQVRIAAVRIAMIRGALALPPSPVRTRLLLGFLPGVHDHAIPGFDEPDDPGDVALHRIVAALQAEGDAEGMLEAVSRTPHHETTLLRGLDNSVLAALAAETQRSTHQRVEAVLGLGDSDQDIPATVRALVPLLRDSDANVRTAAVRSLGRIASEYASVQSSDAASQRRDRRAAADAANAISAASRTEHNERVRFAMYAAAFPGAHLHVARAGQPAWAFVSAVDGVRVRFAVSGENRSVTASAAAARMVPATGGPAVACTTQRGASMSFDTMRMDEVSIDCPTTPSGRFRVEVDFAITGGGASETRTIAAGEIVRP